MLPAIIVDKSVLQMLTHAQLDEMAHVVDVICVPTLTREIVADLKREPNGSSQRSTAEQRVRDLARRMTTMHLITPVTYRKLALSNLWGNPVPMNGQVHFDSSARNVYSSGDGRRALYDATQEQNLWRRWAAGDFSITDQEVAQRWRDELDAVDLAKFNADWAPFVKKHIGKVRSVDEAIGRVDDLLQDPNTAVQAKLIGVLFVLLKAPPNDLVPIAVGHALSRRLTITQYAPYAGSILRTFLVFLAVSSAKLVPQRASNGVDIQYLFYAPFGFGFASHDVLHQRLWSAVTSGSVFMSGAALQADLAARVAWRTEFEHRTEEAKRQHYDAYSHYPIELPNSPINAVWERGYPPRAQFVEDLRNRRPLNEVEAESGPKLKQMMHEMNALRDRKPQDAGEWPLGPRPGHERPGV